MKIQTTDFHTAIKANPSDPKSHVQVHDRGSVVEVSDKLGKELIDKGKAKPVK